MRKTPSPNGRHGPFLACRGGRGGNGRDKGGKRRNGLRKRVYSGIVGGGVARLRSLMLDAVSDDDLKAIVAAMVARVKAQDKAADEANKLFHSGISKSQIAKRLGIGRTSVRRLTRIGSE